MGMESNRNKIANANRNDRQADERRRTTKAQHHLYASRGFVLRRTGKWYI